MLKSRSTETQIVAILKEADAGVLVKDICLVMSGVITDNHIKTNVIASGFIHP
jgi:hypothetical protein